MTNLKPVSIYELHPDELEDLGYDISGMTQEQFDFLAHRLTRVLEDGPLSEILEDLADIWDVPVC